MVLSLSFPKMFVNRKSVLLIMTANASEVVVFCLTLSVQKLTTTENMKCATDQYFLDSFQTVDHMHVSRQIVHMLGGGRGSEHNIHSIKA